MASVMHRPEALDVPFQTEMDSTSDDTLSLKRKSISLNADGVSDLQITMAGGCDSYVISGMSREERREFRKRLKLDMLQVQGITKKLEAIEQQVRLSEKEFTSEPPALDIPRLGRQASFAGDGNLGTPGAASKEKRTPKANQMYSNSEYFSGKDKMPPPEKLKPKPLVPPKKSGHSKSEVDVKRQKVESARNKRMADLMKQCGTLQKKLMTHKHAWVFNEPVDAVKLGLHDYHKIIRKPMDLGTIKNKLDGGHYASPQEFADDCRLTFSNAMTYNPPGHDVYVMADILRKIFEERWKGIKEKLDEEQMKCRAEDEVLAQYSQNQNQQIRDLKQHLMNIEDQLSSLSRGGNSAGTPRGNLKQKSAKRLMTFEEKRRLSLNLEKIPADKVEEIVQIIRKHNNLSQNEDTIEVDIDKVDNDTLWELHKLVSSSIKPKNKKKASQKQADLMTDDAKTCVTGPGESPRRNRKSGEGAEEDVDIDVDDDMPTANFPPVVIDKDAANEGSKSSGGSSSSSSGSSSSESESGSSSGSDSEAEGPQTAGIEKPTSQKEPMGLGAVREQMGSPSLKNEGAKKPLNTSPAGAVEQPDVENADTLGVEIQVENPGEKLQSERQMSPEKVLRAALLKGRFADTILKAREKALLNKSDSVDPEKLRKDREELERKQREDRARLQAEAKAAELARKKVEAEAAFEAKKKREVEREAARKALQQMERTVEIDGQCEILKDFELLRSTSMEHFQSSAGEVSPANSPGGLTAFSLQGGANPLEQLGLFMKLDEDEDEKQGDGEVAYAEGTDENGEVEEGEID